MRISDWSSDVCSSDLQHSDFLEAWFCHTPGIKVVMPSNPVDGYGLLRSAIEDPDPVLFIEHLPSYWLPGAAPERGSKVPIGKARIDREGRDVPVIGSTHAIHHIAPVHAKPPAESQPFELSDTHPGRSHAQDPSQ